jgi:hypothetical protein
VCCVPLQVRCEAGRRLGVLRRREDNPAKRADVDQQCQEDIGDIIDVLAETVNEISVECRDSERSWIEEGEEGAIARRKGAVSDFTQGFFSCKV